MPKKLPIKSYPTTHLGWHQYYIGRFNKSLHKDAAIMAMYYLFLHLRDTPNETP